MGKLKYNPHKRQFEDAMSESEDGSELYSSDDSSGSEASQDRPKQRRSGGFSEGEFAAALLRSDPGTYAKLQSLVSGGSGNTSSSQAPSKDVCVLEGEETIFTQLNEALEKLIIHFVVKHYKA